LAEIERSSTSSSTNSDIDRLTEKRIQRLWPRAVTTRKKEFLHETTTCHLAGPGVDRRGDRMRTSGCGGQPRVGVRSQRDDAGFFTTSNERFGTDSFALTSDKIDLGQPGPDDWWADRDLATVRIAVDNADARPVFVGIGPESEVEASQFSPLQRR